MHALATVLARRIARALAGRPGSADGPATLELEQVLPLDPRRRLCLVRCGSSRLLLLTGGPQDLALGWLSPELPDEAGS